MGRLALLGGSYSARSIIANGQRCINYYPEVNPKDAPVPVTHYQRPGLRPLVQPSPAGAGRGLFRASNGNGYCVVGQNVFAITFTPSPGVSPFILGSSDLGTSPLGLGAPGGTWTTTLIGTLTIPGSMPCRFTDNGITGLLVDGTPVGYQITLATNAFSVVNDPTGTFVGANTVDYIDTFILFNFPGTNLYGSTHSNQLVFDPLYIAGKTDYPDPLTGLIVNRHQILLIGNVKTEFWYDAGLPNFPFAEVPGAYVEHGSGAVYSIASADISVFFVGQDLQGQGYVFRVKGYECKRISNHALEYQLRKIAAAGTITDAVGYTYQQDGHLFYVVHFPSGNQTWVFDDSTDSWHQECWTDNNGNLNRHRGNDFAFLNFTNTCIDWQYGTIYAMDPAVYTDTVNNVAYPISFIRTFPHIMMGEMNLGAPGLDRPVTADGKRIQFKGFWLDLECGNGPRDLAGNPAMITLRFSDDRGKTFLQDQLQSSGQPGEWLAQPQWRGLGIARDRIFEIEHNIAGEAALNGAWVDATVLIS